ncbi:unnamed protein product [Hyaloperonospora brassicae]|uniref:E2F/DP family winged-helix DNA-binding domain-containing protein n=1 Tax=Hyaloperonospora brassicae TaxID=162125 RepID=A0AAV0T0K5_HYABA|nr:unnamed protein product [Hyaloperonospora brassicae]
MKTQRVRRRKLRFGAATKDAAAPIVTVVTVERASKHLTKRRKRQQRSRQAPACVVNTARCTPHDRIDGTWSHIEEQFTAAKSLGDITRIVLRFFKEHEDLQGAAFPIVVPSSEIYQMKVPRKRRIYDVLHVLEGIGVIKRVRCDETRRTKGGYFLYFGKAAVVQRLAEMKDISAQAMKAFRRSYRPLATNTVEEDCAVVRAFETQAAAERWPCLVTTTVCFLGLLFQQDYQVGMTLPAVSSRLIEAKKLLAVLEPSSPWIETPYNDVHRRVYDVMAVLVSCNMIDTSLGLSCDPRDKCFPRKHARFNYNVFTNPGVLFAFHDTGAQGNDDFTCEAKSDTRSTSVSSPALSGIEDRLISPPSAYWRSVQVDATLAISPIFASSPVGEMSEGRNNGEMANREPLCYGDRANVTLQFSATSSCVKSESTTKCQPEEQSAPRIQDLFSPLGKKSAEGNEWYDDSLKQLGRYDAGPIDWDITRQLKDSNHENWGSTDPAAIAPFAPAKTSEWRFLVDNVEVRLVDLSFNEVEDVSTHSRGFVC